MKIEICEYDSFFIELKAETLADAALLARMGIKATNKVSVAAYASKEGTISAQISIGKSKLTSGEICRK